MALSLNVQYLVLEVFNLIFEVDMKLQASCKLIGASYSVPHGSQSGFPRGSNSGCCSMPFWECSFQSFLSARLILNLHCQLLAQQQNPTKVEQQLTNLDEDQRQKLEDRLHFWIRDHLGIFGFTFLNSCI